MQETLYGFVAIRLLHPLHHRRLHRGVAACAQLAVTQQRRGVICSGLTTCIRAVRVTCIVVEPLSLALEALFVVIYVIILSHSLTSIESLLLHLHCHSEQCNYYTTSCALLPYSSSAFLPRERSFQAALPCCLCGLLFFLLGAIDITYSLRTWYF